MKIFVMLVMFLVLTGCTITTVGLRYYDNTRPVEEYSRVYFKGNLAILTFNEDDVFRAFSLKNTIVIPGGEQTFGLQYVEQRGDSIFYSNTIKLNYVYQPDRFYYVYPIVENNTVRINVFDATDVTAEDLKKWGWGTDIIKTIIARRTDSEKILRKKAKKS